jgi:enoyl-CoA hydratase
LRGTSGRLRPRLPRRLGLFRRHKSSPVGGVRAGGRLGLHVVGGIAVITIRRPEKMNAMNEEMWVALTETVRMLSRDERVRVLIFRGEGDSFCTGADLAELGAASLSRAEDIFHRMEECVSTIEESPLPTIACVRGYSLGTGLELALACDLRVVDGGARFGMPIARLGITLTEPFVRRLVALIGPSRMKELVYTGRLIDAPEALRWGLVNRVVEGETSVLRESLELAGVIRQQSGASIRAAKRWGGSGSGRVPSAYNYVDPADFPEGVRAFLERRPPRFYEEQAEEEDAAAGRV